MSDDKKRGAPEKIDSVIPFTPETASKIMVDAWNLASRIYPFQRGQHMDEEARWRGFKFDPGDCFYPIAEMSPELFEFYRTTFVAAARYYGRERGAKEVEEQCERQSRLVPGLNVE